ncbi:CHASE3 domain-containing protein [Antarcticirhabdus aurantiaca]|uniref:CHASE3 domain-containing protein n=1 Tax=Antarcticirhabdus aurantiaca TaxID=2606717 RepID=A0ACD4NML5_9HYPH|nr:CHASE3 domain-containing protein [Antarcticirhabdus aurantiaca]WAJ28074.1 CHASE3 domain-containing protein [Jeongeuplla avenae]
MSLIAWARLPRHWLTTPLVLRSVPVGVVILAGVVATTWTHSLLGDHRDLVVHTYRVIDTTKDVLIALDDAETGERGYLLSGDRRFLDPYDKALARLGSMRGALRGLVADNAEQIGRLERLDGLVDAKLDELATSIALRNDGGFEAARGRAIEMMERGTMDEIRRVIGTVTQAEHALLDARGVLVARDENRVRLVALLVALASLVVRTVVEIHLARRERASA